MSRSLGEPKNACRWASICTSDAGNDGQRQIPPRWAVSCTPPNSRIYSRCAQHNLHPPQGRTQSVRETQSSSAPTLPNRMRDAAFPRAPGRSSVGVSPAAPLGGIRQHEQVQTCEQEQGEREHRQEAYPIGIPARNHGHEIDDDGHRKDNGQPAVGLPNPFVPVQLTRMSIHFSSFRTCAPLAGTGTYCSRSVILFFSVCATSASTASPE